MIWLVGRLRRSIQRQAEPTPVEHRTIGIELGLTRDPPAQPEGGAASSAGQDDPYDDGKLGTRVLQLVVSKDPWIHRIVERVGFVEGKARFTRSVSVDFTLPEDPPKLGLNPEVALVPLAWHPRERVSGFDLRDESGASMPLLTGPQRGSVLAAGLVAYGEHALGRGLDPDTGDDLLDLATGTPEVSEKALANMEKAPEGSTSAELCRHDILGPILGLAASYFLLLVPLVGDEGKLGEGKPRRVLKYSYDLPFRNRERREEVEKGPSARLRAATRRLLVALPWKVRVWTSASDPILPTQSYHFTSTAPTEVRIISSWTGVGVDPDNPEHSDDPASTPNRRHMACDDVGPFSFRKAWSGSGHGDRAGCEGPCSPPCSSPAS